jgi:hypothetical protein
MPRSRCLRRRSAAGCSSAPPLRARAGSPGARTAFFSDNRMYGLSSSPIIFSAFVTK